MVCALYLCEVCTQVLEPSSICLVLEPSRWTHNTYTNFSRKNNPFIHQSCHFGAKTTHLCSKFYKVQSLMYQKFDTHVCFTLVALSVRRGKVKEPPRFLPFLPDFPLFPDFSPLFPIFLYFSLFPAIFSLFLVNFWLSGGGGTRSSLPPLTTLLAPLCGEWPGLILDDNSTSIWV